MTLDKKNVNCINVKAVKRDKLPEKIIAEIKSLIESNQINRGSRLPSEREFSQMLGVSRPSLREALKALSVLGIIVNKQGEGNFLSNDYRSWPSEPLSIFFSIKKVALIDIYEARKGLEMQAAALAAERRTLEDLKNMKSALKMMHRTSHNFDDYFQHDVNFHSSIGAATKNGILTDLIEKIHKLSLDTRHTLWQTADRIDINIKSDLAKHEKLLYYITKGDAKTASRLAGKHLDEILQRLIKGVLRGENKTEPDS